MYLLLIFASIITYSVAVDNYLCLDLPSLPFFARLERCVDGAVVQLGERLTGSQKVRGSSPLSSTKGFRVLVSTYFGFSIG